MKGLGGDESLAKATSLFRGCSRWPCAAAS